MAPLAAQLPEHPHRLVDLPGHGKSPSPDSLEAGLSIEAQARAVLVVVPERFVTVGHSMGGQVALQMVVIAPQRLAGAVLLAPLILCLPQKHWRPGKACSKNCITTHLPILFVPLLPVSLSGPWMSNW